MWYVAQILFAQKPLRGKRRLLCETCHVLLRAATARKAYHRAQIWAARHVRGSDSRLVGIQHLTDILDEKIGDGTEIGGRFCYKMDPWAHMDELIPNLNDIPIVRLEADPKKPIGQLATKQQARMIKDMFPEKHTTRQRSQ